MSVRRGSVVRYHGRLTQHHTRLWRVLGPCGCDACASGRTDGLRLVLVDVDSALRLAHVRPTSITVIDPRESFP